MAKFTPSKSLVELHKEYIDKYFKDSKNYESEEQHNKRKEYIKVQQSKCNHENTSVSHLLTICIDCGYCTKTK